MSDLNQIHTALERLFNEEGDRIVFWNDPDQEFQNTLPYVMVDGVTNLKLNETGALEAKILLERKEPTGKFLLYAPTEEGNIFEAVRRAIDELAAIVNYIVNNLNGNHIVVTADHGFLFTETARVETGKSKLEEKPDGTILAKKRYLLGPKLPDCASAWHGKPSATANADGEMQFWIPKAANLFHFVGGARFVHGGAMPQETVVPVITVKHVRGKSAQETKTKSVTIQVLGNNHRITTAQHRFQLVQMDAVSDRVKPTTLRVAVHEGDEPVTDIQTVKFESSSGNLDERKKWVSLVLKKRQYNEKTPYRLVLRDAETGIEQQSVEVIIDGAFTDDF